MPKNNINEQLETKYSYPHTIDELNHLKLNNKVDLIEEKPVKRSAILQTANEELQKSVDTYFQFMDIIHSFRCEINDTTFHFEFEGKTNLPPEQKINDSSCTHEINTYLAPVTKEFRPAIKEELLRIRTQLIRNYNELQRQLNAYEKGAAGERYVETQLELIKNKYHFLQNIKFKYSDSQGQTSETDLYIMTPKGLLVCEIKNYGNEDDTFLISKDGQWLKNPNGIHTEILTPSPFAQNTRHCVATEKLLKENGIHNIKIIPVIIMANETVRIQNESSHAVIRASELYHFIEHLNFPENYTSEFRNKIISILQENNDPEDNRFLIKAWNAENAQILLDYTQELMRWLFEMFDFSNTVKKGFKAEYSLGKSIWLFLCKWIPPVLLVLGMTLFTIHIVLNFKAFLVDVFSLLFILFILWMITN